MAIYSAFMVPRGLSVCNLAGGSFWIVQLLLNPSKTDLISKFVGWCHRLVQLFHFCHQLVHRLDVAVDLKYKLKCSDIRLVMVIDKVHITLISDSMDLVSIHNCDTEYISVIIAM